jgi:hypothetical protein
MKAPREQDMEKPALELLALRNVFAWRNITGAAAIGAGKSRRFVRFSTPSGSPARIAAAGPAHLKACPALGPVSL